MWLVSGIHAALSHACGLVILIRYDAMCLASGIHEAFSHACGLVILIGYDAMWLASGICATFSYVGWPFLSGIVLCGW